jgi:hypothetical protein
MAESKKRGVIFAGPDGAIYHIGLDDLSRFKVPPDKIESTILEAESLGFIETHQEEPSDCGVSSSERYSPRPDVAQSHPVIHVHIHCGNPVVTHVAGTEEQEHSAHGGAGSSMSKYAAGSSMSKYAAGSSMSKYAAGSSMSKYAAGSSMSKYAAGSTIASPTQSAITFYGDWLDV